MLLSKSSEYYSKFTKFLFVLIFCMGFTICEDNEYIIGYNRGYADAKRGAVNKFKAEMDFLKLQRLRNQNRNKNRNEPRDVALNVPSIELSNVYSHQPLNQLTNQPSNQPSNQPTNQLADQTPKEPANVLLYQQENAPRNETFNETRDEHRNKHRYEPAIQPQNETRNQSSYESRKESRNESRNESGTVPGHIYGNETRVDKGQADVTTIPDDIEQYVQIRRRTPLVKNYGNLFADEQERFQKGFEKIKVPCLQKVRPEFINCVERATNKFEVKKDWKVDSKTTLGANDCKALWDLMCCSLDLLNRLCGSVQAKLLKTGFKDIQENLENKVCIDTPRSVVPCPVYNNLGFIHGFHI